MLYGNWYYQNQARIILRSKLKSFKIFCQFLFTLDCWHTVHGKVQLLGDINQKTRYWNLKQDALDRTVWRTPVGRGYGTVSGQTMQWTNVSISVTLNYKHSIVIFSTLTGQTSTGEDSRSEVLSSRTSRTGLDPKVSLPVDKNIQSLTPYKTTLKFWPLLFVHSESLFARSKLPNLFTQFRPIPKCRKHGSVPPLFIYASVVPGSGINATSIYRRLP
jgi:hypothetical protein